MNSKITSYVFLLILAIAPSAHSQWRVMSGVDNMTDEKKISAVSKNAEGYQIQVYRIKNNGRVLMNFQVPERSKNIIDTSKPLMYRIDKNKAYTVQLTNPLANLGIINSEWNPKWVNFLVWHGDEKSGFSPILSEIMSGQKLTFRYNIFTGGFKDVDFNLSGADVAIKEAINISGIVSSDQIEAQKEVRKLFSLQAQLCLTKKINSSECLEKNLNCAKNFKDNAVEYKQCIDSE